MRVVGPTSFFGKRNWSITVAKITLLRYQKLVSHQLCSIKTLQKKKKNRARQGGSTVKRGAQKECHLIYLNMDGNTSTPRTSVAARVTGHLKQILQHFLDATNLASGLSPQSSQRAVQNVLDVLALLDEPENILPECRAYCEALRNIVHYFFQLMAYNELDRAQENELSAQISSLERPS